MKFAQLTNQTLAALDDTSRAATVPLVDRWMNGPKIHSPRLRLSDVRAHHGEGPRERSQDQPKH